MSKPRPTPAEYVRAVSDEMTARMRAFIAQVTAAAGGESGQFVVVAIAPAPAPPDAMMAYGPFVQSGASMVADALKVRFAASGMDGVTVYVVPWVAFYR